MLGSLNKNSPWHQTLKHFHRSFPQTVHVSPAIWSSEGCGHSWHSEGFDCQEILVGVGYLRNSRYKKKDNKERIPTLFHYVQGGDARWKIRRAGTATCFDILWNTSNHGCYAVIRVLNFATPIHQYTPADSVRCVVGGWDRHRKLRKTAPKTYDSKWKKGWHQIVSPKHLVEAMLMWHGLSTVNVGAQRLGEEFCTLQMFPV